MEHATQMGGVQFVETESLQDWLSRRMRERGVSQERLEADTEISRGAIQKILRGETERPKLKTLAALAAWDTIPIADLQRRVGIDPGEDRASPDEIKARAMKLALSRPELVEIIEKLLARPDKLKLVSAYLAYIESQDEPPPGHPLE